MASQIFVFNKFSVPSGISITFWIMGLLFGSLIINTAIKLFKIKGKWLITIDHNGINWQSPNELIDPSFKYSIEEMKAIEFNLISDPLSNSLKRRYFIVNTDDSRHELSKNSGINHKKVAEKLVSLGVPKIETRD